jgi:nucleoside-diphosphate-sugar epimerase
MAAGRVFNVGTGSSIQIQKLWKLIGELSDIQIDPVFALPRAGDIHESVADISEIEKTLGYLPRMRLRQGLIDTLMWCQTYSLSDV